MTMREQLEKIVRVIVTLGPIGYLPASGTMATLFTVALLLVLSVFGLSNSILVLLILPLVALSVFLIHFGLGWFRQEDPPEIVLDEMIGYLFAVSIFPLKPFWLLIAAAIFRLFDILKPFGIRRFERLGGVAGVLLDDLLAGFYTQIVIILGCIGYDLWFR